MGVSLFEMLDRRYVYVVDKKDVARRREVVVQNELEDFFVIDRGVGADDRIIVEGTQQVRDGERVRYEFRPPDKVPGRYYGGSKIAQQGPRGNQRDRP